MVTQAALVPILFGLKPHLLCSGPLAKAEGNEDYVGEIEFSL